VQYGDPEQIVLRPTDQFVSDLLGSEDVLRRLSLMPVTSAMRPIGDAFDGEGPVIASNESLRDALSQLLESRAPALNVVDPDGKVRGTIDLAMIRERGVVEEPDPPSF
jgi:osmoprotectant transport system ATP-binding protein